MSRTRSIAEVINEKKPAIRIKDYAKVHFICEEYWNMNYLSMGTNIRRYGSFIFFRDLIPYLNENIKNPLFKKFIYDDMGEIYLSQL